MAGHMARAMQSTSMDLHLDMRWDMLGSDLGAWHGRLHGIEVMWSSETVSLHLHDMTSLGSLTKR